MNHEPFSLYKQLMSASQNAFNDFVGTAINSDDLDVNSELVKSMDRALLRNPEYALPSEPHGPLAISI